MAKNLSSVFLQLGVRALPVRRQANHSWCKQQQVVSTLVRNAQEVLGRGHEQCAKCREASGRRKAAGGDGPIDVPVDPVGLRPSSALGNNVSAQGGGRSSSLTVPIVASDTSALDCWQVVAGAVIAISPSLSPPPMPTSTSISTPFSPSLPKTAASAGSPYSAVSTASAEPCCSWLTSSVVLRRESQRPPRPPPRGLPRPRPRPRL